MTRRVLCWRHHAEDRPGLIGEAFAQRGYELDVVMVTASTPAPALGEYAALVILGSTAAVYDDDVRRTWLGRELELMVEADRREMPILGICFGAQALCVAYGGTVAPALEPEIGWFTIDVQPEAPGLAPGPWFEYHYDHMTLPDTATLWATTPRAVQAFSIGRHLGVQFHPEIDSAQLRDWLAADAAAERSVPYDADALLALTIREEESARHRAQELVDTFLERAGLLLPR